MLNIIPQTTCRFRYVSNICILLIYIYLNLEPRFGMLIWHLLHSQIIIISPFIRMASPCLKQCIHKRTSCLEFNEIRIAARLLCRYIEIISPCSNLGKRNFSSVLLLLSPHLHFLLHFVSQKYTNAATQFE